MGGFRSKSPQCKIESRGVPLLELPFTPLAGLFLAMADELLCENCVTRLCIVGLSTEFATGVAPFSFS